MAKIFFFFFICLVLISKSVDLNEFNNFMLSEKKTGCFVFVNENRESKKLNLSELEKIYLEKKPDGKIFSMSQSDHADLISQFNVTNFPSVVCYENDQRLVLEELVTLDLIRKWFEKIFRIPKPTITTVKNEQELLEYKKLNHKMLTFFGPETDTEKFKAFKALDRKYGDLKFFHMIGKTKDQKETETLELKNYDGEILYQGDWSHGNLKNFIDGYSSFSFVFSVDAPILKKFVESKENILLLIFDSSQEEHKNQLNQFFHVYSTLKVPAHFLSLNIGNQNNIQHMADSIKKVLGKTPEIWFFQNKDDSVKRFTYKGEIATEPLKVFYDDVLANKISRTLKSGIKIENQKGLIYELVADEYKEVIEKTDGDILLYLYREECPQCFTFGKHYEELASIIQEISPKIKFMKISMDNNEPPENLIVKTVPSLFFIKFESKKPSQINPLTEETIMKFLKENNSFGWKEKYNPEL